MSSLRPELHVAQQIRRDKLRFQNSSQHLQDFPNNIEQLSLHQGPGFNLDLLQVRNVRHGNTHLDDEAAAAAALYSSEMISFASPSNPRNTLECQEQMMPHHPPHYASSSSNNIHSSPKEGNWRNSCPHHQVSDWMVNYASCSNESNPNSFLASELNNNNINNNVASYVKPSCNLLTTDLQSSPPSSISGGEIQNKLGEMNYSPPLYHNALQDIFKSTSSSTGAHASEMASLMHQHHGIWGGNNSVPVFQGNQSTSNVWTSSQVLSDCNPHQGLSLSLSSNSQSKPCGNSHFEEGSASDSPQYSKSIMKPSSIGSRDCGKLPLQQDHQMGIIGTPSRSTSTSTSSYRNVGPLGPFTGYATILKSSRFLKPCQQLLDECCCQKFAKSSCGDVPEWVSRDVSASGSANVEGLSGVAAKGNNNNNNSGASSSMLYASKENNSADGGAASSFCLSSRPECQKNKAKLLYMKEEVTRRYKQYHQQMQMVVSSFESVAGLSSATPYISLALKSISKLFRCLKNAISDQLKLTCEVLGEEFSIPTTSTSCKIDNNMARLRCLDQRNKSGGSSTDFLEHQQHVWRPQRGLPERSVAILRAWLFEHFLHPYPTDTDKHMLATQTGLSRNQVSNWFINARVRVWKPMVEEIHMLETKGTTEANQNNSKNEGASPAEGNSSQARVDQPVSVRNFGTHAIAERQFQCLEMGSSSGCGNEEKGTTNHEQQWNQEKRSKLECDMMTPSMDGTLMGFMPYQRRGSGVEVGGLGSVSLTLGLRHGVEGVQHQQQQLQHQEELRRQFGGHMIHDFVG